MSTYVESSNFPRTLGKWPDILISATGLYWVSYLVYSIWVIFYLLTYVLAFCYALVILHPQGHNGRLWPPFWLVDHFTYSMASFPHFSCWLWISSKSRFSWILLHVLHWQYWIMICLGWLELRIDFEASLCRRMTMRACLLPAVCPLTCWLGLQQAFLNTVPCIPSTVSRYSTVCGPPHSALYIMLF